MVGLLSYFGLLLAIAIGSAIKPPVAFAGVLCLFGLKQWGQNSTTFIGATENRLFTNVAIGLLVVVSVVRLVLKRGCVFCRLPPVGLFIVATYWYALTSTVWTLASPAVVADAFTFTGTYALTVALLAPLLISDLSDFRAAMLWTLIIGGSLCILMVTLGSWGLRGLTLTAATDSNPLSLASLGGTIVLIAMTFLIDNKKLVLRLIALACVPFAIALILRSGSRGQLLALVPAFAIVAAIAFRLNNVRSLFGLSAIAGLLVSLGWLASTLVHLDSARWTGTVTASADVAGRFDMAGKLLQAAMNRHALVFGLGNSSSYEVMGIYPHIPLLEVVAEEGIPGTVLYLAILIYAFRSIVRLSKLLRQDTVARKSLALLAGLFVFELVCSQKEGTLLSSVYVYAYAIILGRMEIDLAGSSAPVVAASGGTAPQREFPNLMS